MNTQEKPLNNFQIGTAVIDYYYEFPEDMKLFNEPIRFGFLRGFHPELGSEYNKFLHRQAYENSVRIWLENANGLTLVREHGRDVYKKCSSRDITWLKLQAKEL